MIKVGTELQIKDENQYFIKTLTYEVASQRLQDRKFVIFDIYNVAHYFEEDEILNKFIVVTDNSSKQDFIVEQKYKNSINKLKNQKASHYNLWLDTDSIDIIKANLTEEEYIGALKFNILKYQLRLGKKDCIESDMEKIEDYKRELNDILGAK